MKLLKAALAVIAVSSLALIAAVQFFGMRFELDGSGAWPMISFGDRVSHDREIEANRAAQRSEPAPGPAPVLTPVAQAATSPARAATGYWTDFRGPDRLGIYSQTPLLTRWPSAGLKRLWKQPVGGGYASFVIAEGLAFTIEQRRDSEVVAAYDITTGRERWTNSWKAHFQESMGGDGPRATPVYDSGRLYAIGAEGELRAYEAATGRVLWNKNILTETGATNLTWAQSASPLVVDGKLIALPGGPGGKSVVAYDKLSGKTLWTSQDDEQSYTSPMLATVAGKRQVIVVSALRAMGLDIASGQLLWEFPWVTEYHINSAQPIVTAPNRVFLSAGYGHGAVLLEITPDGARFRAKALWQNIKMKNKFNSSVLYQGHIYGLDEAILACIDANTGDQKWKGGRYGYGQLLLAGGHLVVLSESGEVALVRATPEKHEEIARFEAIDGKTWNYPAIDGGVLYVRNTTEMAAFRISQ